MNFRFRFVFVIYAHACTQYYYFEYYYHLKSVIPGNIRRYSFSVFFFRTTGRKKKKHLEESETRQIGRIRSIIEFCDVFFFFFQTIIIGGLQNVTGPCAQWDRPQHSSGLFVYIRLIDVCVSRPTRVSRRLVIIASVFYLNTRCQKKIKIN